MKRIYAEFDDDGIFVYQAFKHKTVLRAAAAGRFGTGFNRDRVTWIKPSFAWLLHRSVYATKHRMDGIAKIKLCHEGFLEILNQSISTEYDERFFPTRTAWRRALDLSEVCHQWDGDRDLRGRPNDRRAIQIALSGSIVEKYVDEWTLGIEDVTALAQSIGKAVRGKVKKLPECPELGIYELESSLSSKLGIRE
ncbi:MAG: DUF4291 family protein [Planctomycetota bacterium]|nr:DUF4291 family protein [Planctomycetota bacterium]